MADLARRGVVSPSLGEATWRQASAISRWGMGLAGQVRQAAALDPHRLAVIDADTGESLTYAALVARSGRLPRRRRSAHRGCGARERTHRPHVGDVVRQLDLRGAWDAGVAADLRGRRGIRGLDHLSLPGDVRRAGDAAAHPRTPPPRRSRARAGGVARGRLVWIAVPERHDHRLHGSLR
ncbi:hypothetical protein BN13_1870007 [Nostocoides jenkinsii Ben 74]|uniref:AMP-dependent synthetase/ligase domain-containing protein n=1 Tax=Nostocoides jenkinsii Ben 74 TaxID=1193518 RepID=A0A077M433_9MICO|nr:hypothetical protein BN13_1330006 [Tetrasphaera jenkinsii Ben 74]CCI52575.1 hypothetical protein BN13_1870007 [Tetrasphaera jenkinsii Ben 74]